MNARTIFACPFEWKGQGEVTKREERMAVMVAAACPPCEVESLWNVLPPESLGWMDGRSCWRWRCFGVRAGASAATNIIPLRLPN